MAYDLASIRTKIRRLTKSPSDNQISTAEIDQYINNFYLYDLPETLQLLRLKKTLTFYTKPNVDSYPLATLTTIPAVNVLENYITFAPPVFIAGVQSSYFESREGFYRTYPQTNYLEKIAGGNGVLTVFAGTLSNKPIIPGSITISAKKTGTLGHSYDEITVIDDGLGKFTGDIAALPAINTINYDTGAYTISFVATSVPSSGTDINAMYISYIASRPQTVLYYDSIFTLRPVPDQVYPVSIEAVIRPTEFITLTPTQHPELYEWWEYIAIGTARKILIDRLDMESVALIEPEFRKQELLINRRTVIQQSTQKAFTIYDRSNGWRYNSNDVY